ncbi:serine/threonine kinase [Fragilaria crotonensis]|nr:serine/threonine kinase [Fragilaria crotonensis]
MNTSSADPVELSLEYIKRCLTDHELGKGAFGDVFLAEDSRLPKKFAVKMISPTHRDEAAINEIRKTFQKELLTLKTFRHPNIIVLYGYSLNANSTQQCLVYELAANGSLAGFFTDDGNRARLSAGTRLSIMFKLTTTPGLLRGPYRAKVVVLYLEPPDTYAQNIAGRRLGGLPCPYIAAFDVYSIGVVLVELILGCLNGGQSMRNDSHFHDVFDLYVKDERDRLIVDGWEKLKSDADPTIIWNPDALDLACKAAIQCMAPFPEERLSTKELLDTLRDAILLNTKVGLQHPAVASAVDSGPYCLICNEYRTDIKCSNGHALCTACIVDKLGDDNGCDFLCLIKECSSKLPVKRLYGRIPQETYDRFLAKGEDQTKWDECFRRLDLLRSDFYVVKVGVEHTQELLQKQQHMIQRLTKGLNRSLAALALLSSNQFKECPNLVWLNPISVEKKDRSTPKKWIRDKVLQKYSVVFICAHSGEPGHEAFEIEVPRRWIVKVAPWLKLCLQAIKAIATSQALPFPIPNLPFLDQFEMMKTFLDSAVENASTAVLAHCEALLENGTMSTIEASGQMQTLAGDSLQFIAEKARANTDWKASMVPVCRHNGTPIWVKSTYEPYYEV